MFPRDGYSVEKAAGFSGQRIHVYECLTRFSIAKLAILDQLLARIRAQYPRDRVVICSTFARVRIPCIK